jgi:hypothetical protein
MLAGSEIATGQQEPSELQLRKADLEVEKLELEGLTTFAVRLAALCAVQHSVWELREGPQLESLQAAIER